MTTAYTTDIQIAANGALLAGRLHRNRADLADPQPGLVVSGSWLTVKEQMADLYASRFAALGYTVLTFDFTGWGASGGAGRQIEMPRGKMDDIVAATRFLRSLSCVEGNSVGYVAICASAMYAAGAIELGAPIGSLACVAGWLHDTTTVADFYGGQRGVDLRIERAREALRRVQAGQPDVPVPAYEEGNDQAGMFVHMDYYANPARGRIAAWPNEMSEQTWMYWLTFNGLRAAANLQTPVLFVHGDECALPGNVRRIYDQLTGSKRLAWHPGFQADYYDRADLVDFAVAEAAGHFQATLAD